MEGDPEVVQRTYDAAQQAEPAVEQVADAVPAAGEAPVSS